MTRTVRGYYIRVETVDHKTNLRHSWAEKGTLPAEWEEIKQDSSIVEAQIFSATQRGSG
jgi:hypothetical protein